MHRLAPARGRARSGRRIRDGHRIAAAAGLHNRSNLCTYSPRWTHSIDAAALALHAATFQPLPNRLQPLGERDGILYVNDSISNYADSMAWPRWQYRDRPVARWAGGHDRRPAVGRLRGCDAHAGTAR